MNFRKDRLLTEFLLNFLVCVALPVAAALAAVALASYAGISSASIAEASNYYIALAAAIAVILAAGGYYLGQAFVSPIRDTAIAARELSKGNLEVGFAEIRRDEIGDLQKSLLNFSKVFSEREKMKSTFSRYISDYIADEVLTENLGQFQAEYRNVTILFSDIRGFTTVSETIEPKDLFNILNKYFDQMIDSVLSHNGVINKFIGDAIMVLYNAPKLCEHSDIMAIVTAIEMNDKLREFNAKHTKKYGVSLEIGVGVNSGQVIAGNIGSEKRMEYTVIGDNVNVSSRLQSLAKGGEIMISESVARSARFVFRLTDMGEMELKGKKQRIRVSRVDGNLDYESIKKNLTSQDPEICQLSLIALGRVEKINPDADIMPLLKHQQAKVRIMALDLIISRHRAKAEECIMYLLQNDRSEYVRTYAISQIGELKLARFSNFLAQQYLHSESVRLRGATVDCLQKLGDDKLRDRIAKQCPFESDEARKAVATAFESHPGLGLYQLIERLISDDSAHEEKKLGIYIISSLGLSTRVDALNRLFRECDSEEIRKFIVAAFLKTGTCRTVIFLLKNLNALEKEALNGAYKVIAHLISKYHEDEYRYDISVQIQLDIIKSIILSSEGKNFEKLKVALIKNK